MKHAARIFLALVFGRAQPGHRQDLDAEINAFDHLGLDLPHLKLTGKGFEKR